MKFKSQILRSALGSASHLCLTRFAVCLTLLVLVGGILVSPTLAQLQTEGFENGFPPPAWTFSGPSALGGVADGLSGITETEGLHFGWISAGCTFAAGTSCPDVATLTTPSYATLGLGSGSTLGPPSKQTTLMSPTFHLDGMTTISFDVNFLTTDGTNGFADFAVVQLISSNGSATDLFVANTTCATCAAVPPVGLTNGVGAMNPQTTSFKGVPVTIGATIYGNVPKYGPPDANCEGNVNPPAGGPCPGGPTDWVHVTYKPTTADDYRLLFLVSHVTDTQYPSALAMDNIQTTITPQSAAIKPGIPTTVSFDSTGGQQLIHTLELPTNEQCQNGVTMPQLLSTNMIVSNNGGIQRYTFNTPFAMGVLLEQEADNLAAGGTGFGSLITDKCYQQGDNPSNASFLSCPVAFGAVSSDPSTLINITELFDFPSTASKPPVPRGTTFSLIHHPGQKYSATTATDCTTVTTLQATPDWVPVPSGANSNQVCTQVQTADPNHPYDCFLEDALRVDPATPAGTIWGVFGDQTSSGGTLKTRGVIGILSGVATPTTQVSVNGTHVNSPGLQDTSGVVHWFKTSSLSLDFLVNPACTGFSPLPPQCTANPNNGWFAAPVKELAYKFFNTNSPEPLLPDPPNCPAPTGSTSTCAIKTGSNPPGIFVNGTAAQVEFVDTVGPNLGEGIYELAQTGKDTVGTGDRNVQLITDTSATCPNPNNEVPGTLKPPCYSTDLFHELIGIDRTPPTVTFVPPFTAVLNTASSATLAVNYTCQDNPGGSGIASCTGSVPTGTTYPVNTPLPPTNVSVTATDNATNTATQSQAYSIGYEPAGTMCDGDVGHQILQPINNYPSQTLSVFKQGRTVPVKFRVCDANGVSIGTPGTITSTPFTCVLSGNTALAVDETVTSTSPDTTFRFDTTAQQWIFNLGTSGWPGGGTQFSCTISLNDGSTIPFTFALR